MARPRKRKTLQRKGTEHFQKCDATLFMQLSYEEIDNAEEIYKQNADAVEEFWEQQWDHEPGMWSLPRIKYSGVLFADMPEIVRKDMWRIAHFGAPYPGPQQKTLYGDIIT